MLSTDGFSKDVAQFGRGLEGVLAYQQREDCQGTKTSEEAGADKGSEKRLQRRAREDTEQEEEGKRPRTGGRNPGHAEGLSLENSVNGDVCPRTENPMEKLGLWEGEDSPMKFVCAP